MNAGLATLKVEKARAMLAECTNIDEAKNLRDAGSAMLIYTRHRDAGGQAADDAFKIVKLAERRIGEMSRELPKAQGKRGKTKLVDGPSTSTKKDALAEAGVSQKQASRWEKLAGLSSEEFEKQIQVGQARHRKTRDADGLAATSHVAGYDGDEWYTPADYVEAARAVMFGIDVDPASNGHANMTIKAPVYFTKKTDGLAQEWRGNVWLNPPYSYPLVERFTDKFLEEHYEGRMKQGIVLVNASTDPAWFHRLLEQFPVCFTAGRISFETRVGQKFANRVGQAFFYAGGRKKKFASVFSNFGQVLEGMA